MRTENDQFDITVGMVGDGVVCLDFRTMPRMAELDKIGYASIHFQLSPKDARKLSKLLLEAGSKK